MTTASPLKITDRHLSPAQAWVRALELTAPIARRPDRVFPAVIEERATQLGGAPALLSDRESFTYRMLAERTNRYARWALAQGIAVGDTVGLLMPNRPEYLAVWLGITKIGGVVALLNTNLTGSSLAHCLNVAAPKHLIVAAELIDGLTAALPELNSTPAIWVHGANHLSFQRLDEEIERHNGSMLNDAECRPVTIEHTALYIFTSGTTGLPKAATVSHGRVMQWTHWFAGMMDARPADRMYDCLPMYHSVGGVQAPGSVLVAGGSVVLDEKFSARRFWNNVVRWDCTLFQYIGELCRYLVNAEPAPQETSHRIRMACGNGLRPDVWNQFKTRFQIPQIFEFYAATEGNVSLFNIDGEPGAIGRIPSYLAHRFAAALVKFDVDKGEPFRDEKGFCIPCAPNEVGEALGPLFKDNLNIGARFDGYTNREASERKILRDVFQRGDAWFRTGDLMRKDDRGFFFFVDRVGDTFRWKGENVATSEVSAALCAFPGIKEANVYGVTVPGADGRAGMATLVVAADLDLTALRAHLAGRLPSYACPLFLRIRKQMFVTATFKYTKSDLVREGYDPGAVDDPIFFCDPARQAFVRLDQTMYRQIQAGQLTLRSAIPAEPSAEPVRSTVFQELRQVLAGIEPEIASGPIVPAITPQEIRSHLARYDFSTPVGLDELCADVTQMLRTWHVQVTHPRYFGLFNPSVTLASVIADTIVAMYNPQVATWRTSPAANEIERHTLSWLVRKFGLPPETSATFTTGGAEANLTAVIVALTQTFPEYGQHGLRSLSAAPVLYVSREAHHSFNKIAHMTGLGRRAIRQIATDCDLKMDLQDLARQVAEDRNNGFAPFMVVGTCGTTGAGVIDPLPALSRFCRSENLWFHTDAAWGGAAIISSALRHYLAGIDGSDSITCDAHKWFSVPMGAGMFFCRHPETVAAAFHAETSYMPPRTAGPVVDPYTTSIQWSRRFIGLKLFLALAHQGESGYVDMINHQTRMGDLLRKLLDASGWRIVNKTPLPLVCFTRDGIDNTRFLASLHERQIAWMSQVQLAGGAPVLRACVTSFRTTESDVEWVVREMNRLI